RSVACHVKRGVVTASSQGSGPPFAAQALGTSPSLGRQAPWSSVSYHFRAALCLVPYTIQIDYPRCGWYRLRSTLRLLTRPALICVGPSLVLVCKMPSLHYLPTEDMRTDAEKAELMAWAHRQAALNEAERLEDIANANLARNSHHGPTHPLYKPGSTDATAHADSHTGNLSASPVKTCDCAVLAVQLQQTQVKLAELMMRVNAIENRASVAPPSAASIVVDAITKASAAAMEGPACRGSGVIDVVVEGTTNDRPAASMLQVRASSE
ncbi:hypothetical protein V8E53_007718, partial [Lactarius tabidus]